MDLELSDLQELLRATSAQFISDTAPIATVADWAGSVEGVPKGYLEAVAELGWFTPITDPAGAESGFGVGEAAVIAEERGRGLQPGPFISTVVVCSMLARAKGTNGEVQRALDAIGSGVEIATWIVDWAIPGGGITINEDVKSKTMVVNGRAASVEYGAQADWFLVSGTDGSNNPQQVLIDATTPGVEVTPRRSLDITRRVADVTLRDVRVPRASVLVTSDGTEADLAWQRDLAATLLTAESVGAMDRLFTDVCDYARIRTAFGRTIGSFQAVKHQLADLSLAVESAKAIAATATRSLAEGATTASDVVNIAKAWTSDAAVEVAQGCMQVFGGISFAWEHECHLFLRRLTLNSLLFGTAEWHREQLCARHGL
jgi:alkylation response protein AidB-like acyl-CoA dehydrogenase